MGKYVILDTSIYRQLGLKFNENIDYKNFCRFLVATDNEMLVSDIVVKEFTSYYEKNLKEKISNYEKSIDGLKRLPYFDSDKIEIVDYKEKFDNAIDEFEKLVRNDPNHGHPFSKLKTYDLPSIELVDFILACNHKGIRNIQVRDFLIWVSVLEFAKENMFDRTEHWGGETFTFRAHKVAFITDDKAFSQDESFIDEMNKKGVTNLETYNSIPNFLNQNGHNINFLSKELLEKSISYDNILEELKTDSGCFLSYISNRYHFEECYNRKILEFNVLSYEILEFYSYKDENEINKYVCHLKVNINIVYDQDENIEDFLKYLKSIDKNKSFYLESYDNQNHPYFKAPILYMISGELDMEKESIKTIELNDFIPDFYIRKY